MGGYAHPRPAWPPRCWGITMCVCPPPAPTTGAGHGFRRSTTYNRQIVKVGLRAGPQADFLRNICRQTLQKLRSVREEYDREVRGLGTQGLHETLGFRIVGRKFHVDPLIGNAIARQEVPQLVRPRRPPRTQNPRSLEL